MDRTPGAPDIGAHYHAPFDGHASVDALAPLTVDGHIGGDGASSSDAEMVAAVRMLLEDTHESSPDAMGEVLQRAAAVLGVRDTQIWIADYAQRCLLPFGQGARAEGFDIDGTVGGRAFVLGESVESHQDGHLTLWIPLMDGIDRMGVVQFELDADTQLGRDPRTALQVITVLAATELATRSRLSDVLARARRASELSLAAELQWSILPPPVLRSKFVSVAAAAEPAYAVAGDAYDFAFDDGVLRAAIFDAVGHDLAASIIATTIVGAYRWCRRRSLDLHDTAVTLDFVVRRQFGGAKFGTGIVAELDVGTGAFRWVDNGHPAPVLIRDDLIVGPLERTSRPPIGLAGLADPSPDEVPESALQPGDRVLMYTDGLVEGRTAPGELFGLERLGHLIERELASGHANAEVIRRVIHSVVDHHGGELGDDATALLIHWHQKREDS